MNTQKTENAVRIDSKEINAVRHKAERVIFRLCVIITIAAVIVVILSFMISPSDTSYIDDIGLPGLGMIFGTPLIILVSVYYMYADTRAYAIKASEKNFPEIYHKSVEFANKLGLKKTPAVYIQQHNGVLNAFAAAIIGRRYVHLNAEFVEIAYMENKDFDAVYFVMAHEFGHQYCKHPTFHYSLLTFVGRLIPVFGPLLSRSQEYSADRIAQLLMDNDCVDKAMTLIAGRHLYKYIHARDYIDDEENQKGLFMWIVNLTASHPVMPKRIAALADPQKKSGKLF